ncbi:integrase [Cupriavidus sp. CV2]|uniref:integrase n=1 Tax=Cupriavidus ulmosensis TaxID=3065913 RepID=UPI00296A997F|nr:integrase [Cupriavidus sp. CV2]MDW3689037.1 integrase [Cupriavidus sp. CV2]
MLLPANPIDKTIVLRLLELLRTDVLWHRSLWGIGTVFSLDELLDASAALQSGTLSEASVRQMVVACKRLVGKDLVLEKHEKSTLNELLKDVPRFDGLAYHSLREMRAKIAYNYLLRFRLGLEAGTFDSVDRVARSIAAHLLDSGFSSTYLTAWFKARIDDTAPRVTLSDLCVEAHEQLSRQADAAFEILVAFKTSPRSASGYPPVWLQSSAVSKWLRERGFSTKDVRASGGLVLEIRARDVYSAVESAIGQVDSFVARSSVATGQAMEPWPLLWVRGHPQAFPYRKQHRGVQVKALYREDQIFAKPTASNVDAAIELLAHLQNSSPTAAVAGGWAAVESLLAEPSDRSGAAESLAGLVACSIPRAELTHLSRVIAAEFPAHAAALTQCATNRDRAAYTARLIGTDPSFALSRLTDQLAVIRLRKLLRNPGVALSALQISVADAFHRLYRQRNLILHAGVTDSIALRPTLRTAARLAGAGIDRIAHGYYVEKLTPLELAARARVAIRLVQPGNAEACVDLLGTR